MLQNEFKQFSDTGALELLSASVRKLAMELDAIGRAIQSNTSFVQGFDYDEEMKRLKSGIDTLVQNESNTVILKKILVRQSLKPLRLLIASVKIYR